MKVKALIIDYLKKNVILRKIIRKVFRIFGTLKYLKYYILNKVDENLILFESYSGKSYSDTPKAIFLELLNDKKYENYKFVWCFKNPDKYIDLKSNRVTVIKSKSKSYYKYFSKSKYWIVNSIVNESIIKKKKQVYVQCWHGTPLKKLRCDIEVNGASLNTIEEIKERNDIDAKRFDYFISPSSYATSKFISAFNLKKLHKENIIIEKGYPRNVELFTFNIDKINSIKNSLKIPNNKKVIMYAPTFRDNQHKSGIGYTYNPIMDFDHLKEKLKDEYVILFRAHYFISNTFDFEKYKDFVINVSEYDNINDLYIISDILITDYSSVFFDYANLKRPIIFYMYDLDEYKNNLRDFYINLDELPGPITKNEEEIINEIKNINNYGRKYKKKYDKFNLKYNYLDDAKAANRVIKEILDESVS